MMHIYVLSIPLLLMNLQIMSGEIASFNRKQLHKRNSPVAEQDLEVLEVDCYCLPSSVFSMLNLICFEIHLLNN